MIIIQQVQLKVSGMYGGCLVPRRMYVEERVLNGGIKTAEKAVVRGFCFVLYPVLQPFIHSPHNVRYGGCTVVPREVYFEERVLSGVSIPRMLLFRVLVLIQYPVFQPVILSQAPGNLS